MIPFTPPFLQGRESQELFDLFVLSAAAQKPVVFFLHYAFRGGLFVACAQVTGSGLAFLFGFGAF